MNSHTKVERTSDREHVATRTINGPARLVFEAWTTPELIMRWWTPKSFGITFLSCEMDVRTGGAYRFVFSHASSEQPMAFFGRYIDVIPASRLVWTNEEDADGPLTTVTFEEEDGKTRVAVQDLYASKEAFDYAIATGSTGAWPQQFEQLDDLLTTLDSSV
jgi:uncharacterized protein YndB with AHSA1/START domain